MCSSQGQRRTRKYTQRSEHGPGVLGAGEWLFPAPLALEPKSTTAFSGGAVAHVYAAHP
jgi:hypothetical protein